MLLPRFKNIKLINQCDLQCPNCSLWENPNKYLPTLEGLLESCKNSWIVNICGGNPLLSTQLPEILRLLRNRGHFILLTTNGLRLPEIDQALLTLVDLPIIYFPAFTVDDIREITGFNVFNKYLSALEYLQDFRKKHLVHFTVNAANIEQIPLLRDYQEKHAKTNVLVSHQNNNNPLSRNFIKYFKYYESRPNFFTYSTKRKVNPELCLGCLDSLEIIQPINYLFFLKAFYKIYW